MKAIARRASFLAFVAMLAFSGCQSHDPLMAPPLDKTTANIIRAHQQGLQWLEHSQNGCNRSSAPV